MANPTPTSEITELRARFERRANWLSGAAAIFLMMIVGLLIFGGVIVYQAPALTIQDISQSYGDRMAATTKEIQRLQERDSDIVKWATPEFKACMPAFREAFKEWIPAPQESPDDRAFHSLSFSDHVPDMAEIRSDLIKMLSAPELSSLKKIGVQLSIQSCGGPDIFFVMSPQEYNVMEAAIAGREVSFDRQALNKIWDEHKKNIDQQRFLQMVVGQIRTYQVEQQARGSPDAALIGDGSTMVWQRLIQTTVTRFGILAVVGFFVSLLVSLYRYNVRLAAFYRARADGLLFFQQRVVGASNTIRNFEMLERILTPQLDFGRTPATPMSQLIDLVRAARGTDRPEE